VALLPLSRSFLPAKTSLTRKKKPPEGGLKHSKGPTPSRQPRDLVVVFFLELANADKRRDDDDGHVNVDGRNPEEALFGGMAHVRDEFRNDAHNLLSFGSL
jgi:hypothetical protein